MLYLHYVAHSEIGLVRKNNQDSGYASPTMLVVADGMGGAAAGDLASAVAITDLHAADESWDHEGGMLSLMEQAVTHANQHIADLVVDNHDLDGMGTTISGGLFDGERLGIAHIGDSRGYLLRDGEMSRLTSDHSWIQSLVDQGRVTEEEALYHPHRSLLLKVLNGHPNNTPDLFHVRLQPGDRLMFCSDGLCGLVDDHRIKADLEIEDRDEALAALIEAAHEGGGLDNITIIISDVLEEEPDPAMQPLVLGAAVDVEIPAINRPTFVLDDEAEEKTVIRPRPEPASQPTPTEVAEIIPAGPVEDPEDARYRPRPRPRRRWLLGGLTAILLLGLVGGLGGLMGRHYLDSRYYVGNQGDVVAVYQGVPGKLGPFDLSKLVQTTDIKVSDLPVRFQEDVRSESYRDSTLDGVNVTLEGLRRRAEGCIKQRAERSRATETPTPTPTPEATPDESPSPEPTTDPSATPTPTPAAPTSAAPTQPPPEEC